MKRQDLHGNLVAWCAPQDMNVLIGLRRGTHREANRHGYDRTRFAQTREPVVHWIVKRVADAGTFRFQQRLLYIANTLVDQHIGLKETYDGVWAIYFNTVLLPTLDERDFLIRG